MSPSPYAKGPVYVINERKIGLLYIAVSVAFIVFAVVLFPSSLSDIRVLALIPLFATFAAFGVITYFRGKLLIFYDEYLVTPGMEIPYSALHVGRRYPGISFFRSPVEWFELSFDDEDDAELSRAWRIKNRFVPNLEMSICDWLAKKTA